VSPCFFPLRLGIYLVKRQWPERRGDGGNAFKHICAGSGAVRGTQPPLRDINKRVRSPWRHATPRGAALKGRAGGGCIRAGAALLGAPGVVPFGGGINQKAAPSREPLCATCSSLSSPRRGSAELCSP